MCQLKKDPRLLRDRKYTILDICRPTFEFLILSIIIIHLRTRLNEINSYEWLLVQIYLAMHYYKNFFQQNITVPKINLFFFFYRSFPSIPIRSIMKIYRKISSTRKFKILRSSRSVREHRLPEETYIGTINSKWAHFIRAPPPSAKLHDNFWLLNATHEYPY